MCQTDMTVLAFVHSKDSSKIVHLYCKNSSLVPSKVLHPGCCVRICPYKDVAVVLPWFLTQRECDKKNQDDEMI